MKITNPLDTFSTGSLEVLREKTIDELDQINAQRIIDYIKQKLQYDNYCKIYRWDQELRKNNIDRLQSNGFHIWKISIVKTDDKQKREIYYILSEYTKDFEPTYKEELKFWDKRILSSEYIKL